MQNSLKKKSQSLPRLRKVQFQQKSNNLAKLFAKESPQDLNAEKIKQDFQQMANVPDPEQRQKQKVNQILLKSKNMIEKNKDKIDIAKKFRILKKKSSGPFLTGVDIYKEQEEYKPQQQPKSNQSNQDELKKMLTEKYDDLAQLRKMIKKTSKNLGAYKQQTLSIQKNLCNMADRYGDVGMDVLSRKKLHSNVYHYQDYV